MTASHSPAALPVAALPALRPALLTLRLTLAAFFAVWVIEKFLHPEKTAAIFAAFYGVGDLGAQASYAIGVVQAVVLLAFTFGAARTYSYGALLLIHAFSTVSTWQRLITPYEQVNHLFWAAVPTLGALILLFMLRKHDTLMSVGR